MGKICQFRGRSLSNFPLSPLSLFLFFFFAFIWIDFIVTLYLVSFGYKSIRDLFRQIRKLVFSIIFQIDCRNLWWRPHCGFIKNNFSFILFLLWRHIYRTISVLLMMHCIEFSFCHSLSILLFPLVTKFTSRAILV